MRPKTTAVLMWVIAFGLTASTLRSQSVPVAFEVVSVKLNKSGDVLSSLEFLPGGRFRATNATARELIRAAYGLQTSQLNGGPNWIGSERFDISAKTEGQAAPSRMMLQALLAERFKLTTHKERREGSLFVLVMARSDGRLGPQLSQSHVDCAAIMAVQVRGVQPLAFPNPNERQACDMFIGVAPRFAAEGVSMEQLAANLSRFVGRIVIDRTELRGLFDFELQWTPELPQRPTSSFRLNGVDVDPDGPSLFTALQEQLGLKLQSDEGLVEVLVIDHVERPTED